MAPKHHLRWLYGELPTLVSEEVLSAEGAARVQTYYGALETRGRSSLGIVICSILGSVLLGAGIILLFAHNWQQLSRPLRTVLALLPLVIAQGVTGWAIVRRPASAAWREGAAVFLLTMIGASIALVGQTYHIPGDMARFLLTWILLDLPLVYLAEASVVAALVWIGATCWAAVARGQGASALFFWPLVAAVVPHLWMTCRTHVSGMRAVLLGWVLCLCLSMATAITLEQQIRGVWLVVYAGLFTGLYLVDAWAYDPQLAVLRRPFRLVGAGGIAYLAVLGTYRWVWRRFAWSDVQQRWLKHAAAISYERVVVLCGVLVTVILLPIWREPS